jgi:hypothetical protein
MISDDDIFEIKKYIEGTIKSMLGWYDLENSNKKDIICIIIFYILNKFINENINSTKFYYYFVNNHIFIIHIIINNGKYDLIFNENIDKYNNCLCTFTITTNKDTIIFEKYDYIRSVNLHSKFIKKMIKN